MKLDWKPVQITDIPQRALIFCATDSIHYLYTLDSKQTKSPQKKKETKGRHHSSKIWDSQVCLSTALSLSFVHKSEHLWHIEQNER